MTVIEQRNERVGKKIVSALEKRNIEAFYAATKEDALKKALSLISDGCSVGWGGSSTLDEIGLKKVLKEGNYQVVDRDEAKSAEERTELMHKVFGCDYFLMSTNALSEDGVLVNIDGIGNRIAAMCYGPKHVLIIAGINKVVKTEEDALERARTVAAPINAQRFENTPCYEFGSCINCQSKGTICSQILKTRYSLQEDRMKLILVGENLGF